MKIRISLRNSCVVYGRRKPRKIYAEGFENGEDPEHPRERVLNRDQIEDFIRRFEGWW